MKSSCKKIFLRNCAVAAIAGALMVLASCSTKSEPYARYKKYDAPTLFANAEKQLAAKQYSEAVESLEALEILYPFGPHAEQTQLNLIYAYYKARDRGAVTATADRYVRLYPRGRAVAYAYYMKAMANFNFNQSFLQKVFKQDKAHRDYSLFKQSYRDFRYVSERYPNSPYAAQAKANMVFLLDMLARAEYYAADYYFRRGAHVAAANRAVYIVDHYPQSTETAKALALMVRAYRLLNTPEKAENALSILALNFPDSAEYHALTAPAKAKHRGWGRSRA